MKEHGTLTFDEFWLSGPWLKLGKKRAARLFMTSVKTDQDREHIETARDKYAAHLDMNSWKQPQHGATWFRNWEDWVEFEEPAPRHVHTERCREPGMCRLTWGQP